MLVRFKMNAPYKKVMIQDPAFQHCLVALSGAIYLQLFGKDLENPES